MEQLVTLAVLLWFSRLGQGGFKVFAVCCCWT